MKWQSTICDCLAYREVDTKLKRMLIKPCSYEHTIWNWRVAEDFFIRRFAELKPVGNRDIKRIEKMLVWKDKLCFQRPNIQYESNGLTAYQCYLDWDGRGIEPPSHCEEPELLADLIQAKKNREFTIDQWMTSEFNYLTQPEELFEHPGMDIDLFQKLFDRNPICSVYERIFIDP